MASGTRTRNLFDPASHEPYKLSRSKLELFLNCPRCFYLDRRLGIGQPPGPAFTLNTAVDLLLKREFDVLRRKGEPHPLMVEQGIDAVPLEHPQLPEWRDNFHGVQYEDPETNFLVFGAIDDLWLSASGKMVVVDYKATSTDGEVTLDGEWKAAYKRQMEIYQWLLRRNGFAVSDTGYFVYVNADRTRPGFDARLEFLMKILPYKGDDSWVGDALREAHECLQRSFLPLPRTDCPWCAYRKAAQGVER